MSAMWSRGVKVKHWTLHLRSRSYGLKLLSGDGGISPPLTNLTNSIEFGRRSCVSRQSYSTTGKPPGNTGGSIVYLHNSERNAELCLVGVNHVSFESPVRVRHAIRKFKPNVVALELCRGRAAALLSGENPPNAWMKVFSVLKRLLEYRHSCVRFEKTNKGSKPGDEFLVAIQEGRASGARIILIDQDFKVISAKVAKEISFWKMLGLIYGVALHSPKLFRATIDAIHDMRQRQKMSLRELLQHFDVFSIPGVIEELCKAGDTHCPGLMRALLHDRNAYMVTNLRRESGKVLAVVGAAHVPGMCDMWQAFEVQGKKRR